MIISKRTNSNDSDFSELTAYLDKDLRHRYGSSQDEFDQYNIISHLDTVVIAYKDNKAVGCGCFKTFEDDMVEVKRMFVDKEQRGKGIATAILKELENWADEIGFHSIVLETGILQPEALQLYKKQGYQIIPNYDQYIGNDLSICMKKSLGTG